MITQWTLLTSQYGLLKAFSPPRPCAKNAVIVEKDHRWTFERILVSLEKGNLASCPSAIPASTRSSETSKDAHALTQPTRN